MAQLAVYPACAGIDPPFLIVLYHKFRLPRMRGDRPQYQTHRVFEHGFTPHARGSTFPLCGKIFLSQVYPACAGIDLSEDPIEIRKHGFTPHARGSTRIGRQEHAASFVYPACAGIDLDWMGK